MDKRFLAILAAIIIIFGGIFAISQNNNKDETSNGSNTQATNHVTGKGQKGVTLIEYGDYQCPVCESYYLPLKQAYTQMDSDIYFQFRNLPLSQVHPNAFAAARAAEAAGLQNKYWEMHDKLYEDQNAWASSNNALAKFTEYAQGLSLNIDQFKADYASSKVNNYINADIAAFDKTGQDKATPTFFLNGVYLPNSELSDPQTGQPSADKIMKVIQAEIDKKQPSSNQ